MASMTRLTVFGVHAICLLPSLLAIGLYWLIGRRAAPRPWLSTWAAAIGLAIISLLALGVAFGFAWLAMDIESPFGQLVTSSIQVVLVVHVGVMLMLMKSRSRGRLLLGWVSGDLLALIISVYLLSAGLVRAIGQFHSTESMLKLAFLLLPLLLSSGPLLPVPLVWLWHWRARKAAENAGQGRPGYVQRISHSTIGKAILDRTHNAVEKLRNSPNAEHQPLPSTPVSAQPEQPGDTETPPLPLAPPPNRP